MLPDLFSSPCCWRGRPVHRPPPSVKHGVPVIDVPPLLLHRALPLGLLALDPVDLVFDPGDDPVTLGARRGRLFNDTLLGDALGILK